MSIYPDCSLWHHLFAYGGLRLVVLESRLLTIRPLDHTHLSVHVSALWSIRPVLISTPGEGKGGGGLLPYNYGLHRYMQPQRVWFFFSHFGN